MTRSIRAILGALILSAALALPAFAATAETLTLPATVTGTFPATAVYSLSGPNWQTEILHITNLTTNAVLGMQVDLSVSTLTGPATLPTTVRGRWAVLPIPTGWAGGAARLPGAYTTSSFVDQIISRATAQPVADTFDLQMYVPAASVVVPGTYAGTLSFSVVAN